MPPSRLPSLAQVSLTLLLLTLTAVAQASARHPDQMAAQLARKAQGLGLSYLTRQAAEGSGPLLLWPQGGQPTHLLVCVDQPRQLTEDHGEPALYSLGDAYNASLQRIDLLDGKVETVVRGLARCAAQAATPWGTLLIAETRDGTGALYELLDPLAVSDLNLVRPAEGQSDALVVDEEGRPRRDLLAYRQGLPNLAWGGVVVLPDGTLYALDRRQPGSDALLRFAPLAPYVGARRLALLEESPLRHGELQGLTAPCAGVCPEAALRWEPLPDWRPAPTGGEQAIGGLLAITRSDGFGLCWGEGRVVNCVTQTAGAAPRWSNPIRASGLARIAGLALAPSGLLYLWGDTAGAGLVACLPDGEDADTLSDGCEPLLLPSDPSARVGGLVFTPDGRGALLSLAHSDDAQMGAGSDDILRLGGMLTPNGGLDLGRWFEQQRASQRRSLFGFGPMEEGAVPELDPEPRGGL